MLVNIFPTMFLALIAHTVLRVGFGLILLTLGYRHLTARRLQLREAVAACVPVLSGFAPWFAIYFGLVEIVLGLMFVFGAYTQVAALVTGAYALKMLFFRKRFTYPLVPPPSFYLLSLFVACSLFITGAGAFALDIPL